MVFPYFLQFKSEFGNKVFTIWATVTLWSCFCWLYRTSPSLAAKNIINMILVFTIHWCSCVELFLMLLKRVFTMTSVFPCQYSVSLCPASFCTSRPNLPITPVVSWLPAFALQSPMLERTSFFGVSSRRYYRSSQNCSASSTLVVGA